MFASMPSQMTDTNDPMQIAYFAEQAAVHARNHPQNMQAQIQAAHWAERLAAARHAHMQTQMQMMQQQHGPVPSSTVPMMGSAPAGDA